MRILLVIILMMSIPIPLQASVSSSPEFVVGKVENGDFFMKAEPLNFTYAPYNYFKSVVKGGVAFTAPRSSGRSMNHYANTLLVRNELSYKRMVLFVEFNWSNAIAGRGSPVSYFSDTYQALGVRFEF